ncbi:extracellular solute-binding protein [Streptomyces sp. NPDC005969]|uniref:ABC transporter substrate-binding protein n=1 Tax=Streptomyces sp. NPDC005969 TaxID=3156722 RepID=UPI0033F8E4B5
MRSRAMLSALAFTAALALSGCAAGASGNASAQGDGSKGKVTLTFLTFETPNLTARYRDDAIVIAVSPNGFAQAGQLAPWTDAELVDFVSPHSNPIGGKVYQLPFNTQPTPLVYYNKSVFAAAGIKAPPKTYAELLDDSAKLKAKGINPFVVGGGGKDTWADMYPLISTVATDTYKQTPDWLAQKAAGKAKFTEPAFTKAAAKVAALAKYGYVDTAGLSRSHADNEQAFRDNRGAMYPMGSWFAAWPTPRSPDSTSACSPGRPTTDPWWCRPTPVAACRSRPRRRTSTWPRSGRWRSCSTRPRWTTR